jgi:hypothetical protein
MLELDPPSPGIERRDYALEGEPPVAIRSTVPLTRGAPCRASTRCTGAGT